MNIILVIADNNGKNILFILSDFSVLTLAEAIRKAEGGGIADVHIVNSRKGSFLRANPNKTQADNLDSLSILLADITKINQSEAFTTRKYYQNRQLLLKGKEKQGENILYINGERKKTEAEEIKYLAKYKKMILSAAKDLKADPYLLGAILIDEDLRRDWIDDWSDWLAKLGKDRTVGIAQIKISTARDLIRRGFYPSDPAYSKISPGNADKISGKDLFSYINYSPEHSIYFAAAKIKQIEADFSARYDLRRKEVVADLYSSKDLESTRGRVAKRGRQIAGQFYKIA